MQLRGPERRGTPSAVDSRPVGASSDRLSSNTECNEDLKAQLGLAASWYAQAMLSTDWETANRGIWHARDTLEFAQRQLALQGSEKQIKARCAELLADVDRASTLLRMRLTRHTAAAPSSGDA
jgi:hypothetical protein